MSIPDRLSFGWLSHPHAAAMFDRAGVPQESAAEVASTTYKVGDACVAVFQPAQPDLATLAADEVALPKTSASHA